MRQRSLLQVTDGLAHRPRDPSGQELEIGIVRVAPAVERARDRSAVRVGAMHHDLFRGQTRGRLHQVPHPCDLGLVEMDQVIAHDHRHLAGASHRHGPRPQTIAHRDRVAIQERPETAQLHTHAGGDVHFAETDSHAVSLLVAHAVAAAPATPHGPGASVAPREGSRPAVRPGPASVPQAAGRSFAGACVAQACPWSVTAGRWRRPAGEGIAGST